MEATLFGNGERTGKRYWGVGLSHNINLAPLRGILSAINRSWQDRHQNQ